MTVVHIENSCGNVKWKKRMPVSDKGKGRGIGLLNVKQSIDKYDGNLQLKQDGNKCYETFSKHKHRQINDRNAYQKSPF